MDLKELRVAKGYTQEELARKLNIAKMSYQRYEYGERVPNAQIGLKLANLLGVNASDLWGTPKVDY